MKKIRLLFIVLISVFTFSLNAQDESGNGSGSGSGACPQIIFDVSSMIEMHEIQIDGPCDGYLVDFNFYLENLSQVDMNKIINLQIDFKIDIEGIDPEDIEPFDFDSWIPCTPISGMSILPDHNPPGIFTIRIQNPSTAGVPGQDGCYYIGTNPGDCNGPAPTICSIVTVDLNKVGSGGCVEHTLTIEAVRVQSACNGWQELPSPFYIDGGDYTSMCCNQGFNEPSSNFISQSGNNLFLENDLSLNLGVDVDIHDGIDADISSANSFSNSHDNFQNIQIYPNPFDNYIEISIPPGLQYNLVSVFNSKGEFILSQKLHELEKLNLDFTNRPEGIYFVKIENENQVIIEKILKL